MKRVLLSGSILVAIAAFLFVTTAARSPKRKPATTYNIQLSDAFGLTTGADFKINGVPAGSISAINLDQKNLAAVVKVSVSGAGRAALRTSATCDSQPQSLIGEYFVSCNPGASGPRLRSGATIPLSHTASTIPADLLLNIMQMPVRDRLPLIINSLGAGVAGRAGDLQQALDRAVPALTETDNLLNLLANDSQTIKALTVHADTVVTALADNTRTVQAFIDYANRAAGYTASQQGNLQLTLQRLPGFLEQLRPAMARLGDVATANTPVAANLRAAAGQLDRLFTVLPGFAHSSLPAFRALGKASVTGKVALTAARPVISELNKFATHTPELAKNLSIVLPDIDTQKNATEPNPRSPGGKGYSGLEAVLQFVYNLAGATNYYSPLGGHELGVDAFVNQYCSPYQTPQTIADNLATNPTQTRDCYSFLGPNQPGVTTKDPSNPSACVPDPGGAPPGQKGLGSAADVCKLAAQSSPAVRAGTRSSKGASGSASTGSESGGTSSGGSATVGGVKQTLSSLGGTISQIVSLLSGGSASAAGGTVTHTVGAGSKPSGASGAGSGGSSSGSGSGGSAQQLLNYLLAP